MLCCACFAAKPPNNPWARWVEKNKMLILFNSQYISYLLQLLRNCYIIVIKVINIIIFKMWIAEDKVEDEDEIEVKDKVEDEN
jgi:hypothetical protein